VPDARDIIGESIVYDDCRNALLWVDICGKRIHRLTLGDMRHEIWPTPEFPTSIGLRKDGGAIVGLTTRAALWNYDKVFETFAAPEPDVPDNKVNEHRVAPDGTFWVGAMENTINSDGSAKDETCNCGAVYRIMPDGAVLQMTPRENCVLNSMAWTEYHGFIFAHTMQNTIFRFATDGTSLLGRQILFGSFDRGLPNGSCLDADGQLWNCRVVGYATVACISEQGTLQKLAELPCSWPTSCTFGGPNLDRLLVTSSRFTMTPKHLRMHPQEGGLFEVRADAKGKPEHRFGA
jgi:sugar lactone lactonase YvrE